MARFPRRARLHSPTEFKAVLAEGRRIRGRLIDLQWRPGTTFRLGITVSGRTAPLASDRNRFKRQIRESFRAFLPNAALCADVVVIVRNSALSVDRPTFRTEVDHLWALLSERCRTSSSC